MSFMVEDSPTAMISMAGYSGTPLPKKLGIKEGLRVTLIEAPIEVRKE